MATVSLLGVTESFSGGSGQNCECNYVIGLYT
jgi:hypothetical protein